MKRTSYEIALLLIAAISLILTHSGCSKKGGDMTAEAAPPPAKVVTASDATLFSVPNPEQFPLATATARAARSELMVTGTVAPDVSRNVPVVSLASGRVIAVHARLGDAVKKGQLLLTVHSDDVSGGYQNYRHAVADEVLARAQLERAKDLHQHGAISLNDLQVAQDVEDKAMVDGRASALARQRPAETRPDGEYLRVCFRSNHRPTGYQRIRHTGIRHPEPVHDFRSVLHLGGLRRLRK